MRTRGTPHGEKGAVAALVAILAATGVIMGMLALSVDVGNIMFERRQLQNGADAASMALAQICAKDSLAAACQSGANASSAITGLASSNSADNAQSVPAFDTDGATPLICGHNAGALPECTVPADATNVGRCNPKSSGMAANTPYVEVRTRTKTKDGGTVLPSFFAQALTGTAPNTVVTACARAAWGPGSPASSSVVSITLSECDWAKQTGYPTSTNYPEPPSGAFPGYSNVDARPDWPATEDTIWSKGNPTTCHTSAPGGTAPGGFAWLTGLTGSCSGTVTDSSWIQGDTGADGCDDSMFRPLVGKVIYIPVFNCVMKTNPGREPVSTDNCNSGVGSNSWYHISGFAAFYLSGYRLTKGTYPSVRPPNALCGGGPSDRCISGWFLKDLIPAGEIIPPTPTDPNYGLTVVKPAG